MCLEVIAYELMIGIRLPVIDRYITGNTFI
jgi:hypothetical protein